MVVGGGQDEVAERAPEMAPPGLNVDIAVQVEPRGPGDAVASAGERLTGRAVIVIAVDTVIRGDLRPHVDAFLRSGAAAGLVLQATGEPREMGIAVLEGDRVMHLEEKPERPRSDLAVVGVWMLGPQAVERVRMDPVINARGESDLTATIGAMVEEGADVRGWPLAGRWLDAGSLAALLATQSCLLADLAPTMLAATESDLSGPVAAGDDTVVTRSQITGPVLLGRGVTIDDCDLGPDVVVGDGAVLRDVRLRHALISAGAGLEGGAHKDIAVSSSGDIGRARTGLS